jgi:hypothetical protein
VEGEGGKPGFDLKQRLVVLWELGEDLLTHVADGVKNSLAAREGAARLLKLVVLFCREKAGCPTGRFPLAFSDMPRN